MKSIRRVILIAMFFSVLLITSCVRHENGDTIPAPEVPGNPSVK